MIHDIKNPVTGAPTRGRAGVEVPAQFPVGMTFRLSHARLRRVSPKSPGKNVPGRENSTCKDSSFYRKGN